MIVIIIIIILITITIMIVIKETIAIIIVIMETIATKRAMCYTTNNEIEFKQQKIRNLMDLQMNK